jgi:hypothetical protein
MIDGLNDYFSDEEKKQLILAYMYGCGKDVEVPAQDIEAFFRACLNVIVEAESIKMVAKGLVLVQWDKETGKFAFAISNRGIRYAEAMEL